MFHRVSIMYPSLTREETRLQFQKREKEKNPLEHISHHRMCGKQGVESVPNGTKIWLKGQLPQARDHVLQRFIWTWANYHVCVPVPPLSCTSMQRKWGHVIVLFSFLSCYFFPLLFMFTIEEKNGLKNKHYWTLFSWCWKQHFCTNSFHDFVNSALI